MPVSDFEGHRWVESSNTSEEDVKTQRSSHGVSQKKKGKKTFKYKVMVFHKLIDWKELGLNVSNEGNLTEYHGNEAAAHIPIL